MTLRTRLTEKLGIKHPILLAPMGSIAGGRLAGAVSDAGGLGLIGGGYGERDWLEQEFAAAGNQRVGCGFITWSLARQPGLLDVALAHGPAALMLSFGDPRPSPSESRPRRSCSFAKCRAAIMLSKRLMLGPRSLWRRVLRRGATAALAPRCRWCRRSSAGCRRRPGRHAFLCKRRVARSRQSQGTHRRCVGRGNGAYFRFRYLRGYSWPDGITGRALRNDFTARWHGNERELGGAIDNEMARYQTAAARGDVDTAVIFTGEGADLINDLPSAGEIVTQLVYEAERALASAVGRVV